MWGENYFNYKCNHSLNFLFSKTKKTLHFMPIFPAHEARSEDVITFNKEITHRENEKKKKPTVSRKKNLNR